MSCNACERTSAQPKQTRDQPHLSLADMRRCAEDAEAMYQREKIDVGRITTGAHWDGARCLAITGGVRGLSIDGGHGSGTAASSQSRVTR